MSRSPLKRLLFLRLARPVGTARHHPCRHPPRFRPKFRFLLRSPLASPTSTVQEPAMLTALLRQDCSLFTCTATVSHGLHMETVIQECVHDHTFPCMLMAINSKEPATATHCAYNMSMDWPHDLDSPASSDQELRDIHGQGLLVSVSHQKS